MIPKDIQLKDSVLKFLKTKTSRPVNFKEIARALSILRKGSKTLKRVLNSLTNSGEIFRTKTGFYGLVREMNLVKDISKRTKTDMGLSYLKNQGSVTCLFLPGKP